MPGFGGLVRLELLVGRPKTLEYLATRARVGADEALAAGLVNAIVAADAQLAWAEQRAADMAGSDRAALAAIKLASATGDERAAFLDIWPARQLPDRLGS
jgi:enoyl-CoA hydratase/carnithine racemase